MLQDRQEYRKIFRAYYNPLSNFAFSMVQDTSASEDIVQDVMVQLWEKRHVLNIENYRSYLFKSVYNRSLEYKKKSNLRIKFRENKELYDIYYGNEDLDEVALTFLIKDKINSSLRQLPPKCRNVFVESKYNGLTYTEISNKYGISVKTVENQMQIAFKKLRELLADIRR